MENETKIGILKSVAKTKGVKFEDQPETWYNPATDEAKEQVKDEYKGKQVEIVLTEKTKFSSMVVLETLEQQQTMMEEEYIGEDGIVPNDEAFEEAAKQSFAGIRVEQDPKVLEKTREMGLGGLIEKIKSDFESRQYTKAVYSEMEKTKLEVAKKGPMKLNYISWAEAWGTLKRMHPTASFEVYENNDGMPFFYNKETPNIGAFVKVGVEIMGVEHIVHLPVMDHANKSLSIEKMTTFDINKNIQRALTKAISLHGMGLYVFRGEDYPEESK